MVGDDVCVKSVVCVLWVVVVEVFESQPVLCVGVQCHVMLQVLLLLYRM